jgi:hypothetical protein
MKTLKILGDWEKNHPDEDVKDIQAVYDGFMSGDDDDKPKWVLTE